MYLSAYGAHIFGRRFSWQHFLSFLSCFFWGVTWHLASPIGREVFKYEWLRFLNSDIFLRVLRIWNNIPGEISWDVLGVFSDPQAFFKRKFTRSEAWSPALGYLSFYPSFPPSFDFKRRSPVPTFGTWIQNPWMISYSIRFERFGPLKNPMFFKGANLQFFGFRADKDLNLPWHAIQFFSAPSFCWGMILGRKIIRFQLEVRLKGFWDSDRGFKRFGSRTFLNDLFFFVNALLQKGPNLRYQIAIEKGSQLNGTK